MNQMIDETTELLKSWFFQERFKFWIKVSEEISQKQDQWLQHRINLAQAGKIKLVDFIDNKILPDFDRQFVVALDEMDKQIKRYFKKKK